MALACPCSGVYVVRRCGVLGVVAQWLGLPLVHLCWSLRAPFRRLMMWVVVVHLRKTLYTLEAHAQADYLDNLETCCTWPKHLKAPRTDSDKSTLRPGAKDVSSCKCHTRHAHTKVQCQQVKLSAKPITLRNTFRRWISVCCTARVV